MSVSQTPGQRKPKLHPATIVLVVFHVTLVFLTLLMSAVLLLSSLDDPHGACQYHGLHCDRGAHMREAVLTGVLGSAALIILEVLLLTPPFRRRRGLSVVVPILCCIGQFIVMGSLFSSDDAAVTRG